jgi:hypothetical protein
MRAFTIFLPAILLVSACKGGHGDGPVTWEEMDKAYKEVSKDFDFKTHQGKFTDKLGKPQKEDGDVAYWWGKKAEACYELSTSPTKGDSFGSTETSKCK